MHKLADGTPLNVAVYRAYRHAGLSHNQALAITAEVGRENAFNANILFGSHIDPASNKKGGAIRNIGMLSWNGARGTGLARYLKNRGVFSRGRMAKNQANLNAQAEYSVREMKTKYRNKLKHFWSNPNANPDSYARELGKNYIVWAYGQRTIRYKGGRKAFNWRSHDNRRRGFLNRLSSAVGGKKQYYSAPNMQHSTPLFYGDSIAHGYRNANHAQGLTKVGASPKMVLEQLHVALKRNPNAFKGQTVILSSGLSNNVSDYGNIKKQLELLQGAGANVQLLGVSNQFNLHSQNGGDMNRVLSALANQYGVQFKGGFNAGKDRVHPASYRNISFDIPVQQPQVKEYTLEEIQAMGDPQQQVKEFTLEQIQSMGNPQVKEFSLEEIQAMGNPQQQSSIITEQPIQQAQSQQPTSEFNTFGAISSELPKLKEQGLNPYQALYSLAQRDDEIGQSIKTAYQKGMNSEQLTDFFGVNKIWQTQNNLSDYTSSNKNAKVEKAQQSLQGLPT